MFVVILHVSTSVCLNALDLHGSVVADHLGLAGMGPGQFSHLGESRDPCLDGPMKLVRCSRRPVLQYPEDIHCHVAIFAHRNPVCHLGTCKRRVIRDYPGGCNLAPPVGDLSCVLLVFLVRSQGVRKRFLGNQCASLASGDVGCCI